MREGSFDKKSHVKNLKQVIVNCYIQRIVFENFPLKGFFVKSIFLVKYWNYNRKCDKAAMHFGIREACSFSWRQKIEGLLETEFYIGCVSSRMCVSTRMSHVTLLVTLCRLSAIWPAVWPIEKLRCRFWINRNFGVRRFEVLKLYSTC